MFFERENWLNTQVSKDKERKNQMKEYEMLTKELLKNILNAINTLKHFYVNKKPYYKLSPFELTIN